ncbi:capsular polysaccharide synthesis protein [Paucibacter sp. APW11]|uniref:Capsular polysaccharide synthesis protein n=2 Tax=Roseateles aquae TaxID=3077235 RepID=A0ABU3P714_9BURK|nr:capsular polysaccharide synthesis protein [Paucibacter sp. APW11]
MSLHPVLSAALIVLALLLVVVLAEVLQVLLAAVPHKPKTVVVAPETAAPEPLATIPRIIWAYWHETPAPDFIQRCKANWQQLAPQHEVRLLHKANIRDWIDVGPYEATLQSLPHYRQADWLRLQLLARHGGFWIDASTMLCESLEWAHLLQQQSQVEFVGFYIDRFSSRADQPIVENWFMAAPPHSRFVRDLAEEFGYAMGLGEAAYLQVLRDQGKLERVVQRLGPDDQRYLIMHVAAAVILDQAPSLYRLALLRAEDSALGFHAALRWRKRHLMARLALSPCPRRLPVLIKLRGGDRRVIERAWERGWVYRGSVLARLLGMPRPRP